MQNPQIFECYLIDMTAVKWFEQQICAIFEDVSKPDALQAMFQMRGIPSGITIASPPLDLNTKTTMILPLADLCGNIDLMNKAYGLYDSYPVIYYDMQYMYCINQTKPGITMKSATDFGTVTFSMRNKGTPEAFITGSCTDSKSKTHYTNLVQEPSVIDDTIQATSTKLATITAVNGNGDITKTTIDDEATTLAYIYAHNDLTVNQVINTSLSGVTVQIIASNNDISCLKPWKNYNFDLDTEYLRLNLHNKEYRILNWKAEIRRQGIGDYIHTTAITLRDPNFVK